MTTIHAKDTCSLCNNYLDDNLKCPECPDCNSAKPKDLFGGIYEAHDPVNSPRHYNRGGLECIDAIEAMTEGMSGDIAPHAANVLKYLWRCEYKNGLQDIEKAVWYLNRLRNRWVQRDDIKKTNVEKSRNGS